MTKESVDFFATALLARTSICKLSPKARTGWLSSGRQLHPWSFSTWVYRIATHVALDRLRSRGLKEGLRRLSTGEDEIAGALPDTNAWSGEEKPEATQTLAREEMNACIRGVVEELPENYRAVLVLSEFEGLRDREIAEIVGDSLGAVKIRLHRGRAKLKAALETKCTFHRDERDVFGCEPKPVELTGIRPKK